MLESIDRYAPALQQLGNCITCRLYPNTTVPATLHEPTNTGVPAKTSAELLTQDRG
jgi:hypothetical protein